MTPVRHDYIAPVLHLGDWIRQHYVPIPDDIAEDLLRAHRRVIAVLNGHETRRAVHRKKDGEYYLVMSKPLLRRAKAAPGDMVAVQIWSDPKPDHVDLAEEFVIVLEQDPEASDRFYSMTAGMRRSISYYVTSAKRTETRIKRSMEMAHKIRTGTLHGDRHE
jgi:Bacteriocin-protection, YdeI or OmpD-Associated/Domain of unknown function (DUF1905)